MAGEPTVGLKAVFDGTAAVKGIKNVTDSIKATEKAAKSQSSATGGIMRLQRSVQSLISTYAAVGAGVLAAGAAVWQSVKAYQAAEVSQRRLEQSIKNAEGSYGRYDAQVQKVIASASMMAAVDDELVADALAQLVQATGDVTAAQSLLGLTLDLAAAKGKDVVQTAQVIGKAYNGNIGALKKYGVAVKEGATVTEVLGEAQKKYAGQAEAYGQTQEAATKRISIAWGNLQEQVGERASGDLEWRLNSIAKAFEESGKGGRGFFQEMVRQRGIFMDSAGQIKDLDLALREGKITQEQYEQGVAKVNAEEQRRVLEVKESSAAMSNLSNATEDSYLATKRYTQAVGDAKNAEVERQGSELDMLRAQENVERAQENLTAAVKEHGRGSREAKIAQLELNQAKRDAAAAADAYKKKVDAAREANARAARQKAILAALKTLAERWDDVADAAQRAKDAADRAGKSKPQSAADARSAGLQEAYGPTKNARGGVYPGNRPTLGLLGEASWGDVVVPMNRRDRGAYELLSTAMKGLGVGGGVNLNITGSKSDAQHIAVATRAALIDILDK